MILVNCPHCDQFIEVIAINCAIFRCGIYKDTNVQIPPHLSKIECDNLSTNDKIYGCSKPFKIIKTNDKYSTVKCDYI